MTVFPILSSLGSKLWSLLFPFCLRKNPQKSQWSHRPLEISLSLRKPQLAYSEWVGVRRYAFKQPLPGEESRCGQAHPPGKPAVSRWDHSWLGKGQHQPARACVHARAWVHMCTRACVCVLGKGWHRAKGTETHPAHTPKAIPSNHDLPSRLTGKCNMWNHEGPDLFSGIWEEERPGALHSDKFVFKSQLFYLLTVDLGPHAYSLWCFSS